MGVVLCCIFNDSQCTLLCPITVGGANVKVSIKHPSGRVSDAKVLWPSHFVPSAVAVPQYACLHACEQSHIAYPPVPTLSLLIPVYNMHSWSDGGWIIEACRSSIVMTARIKCSMPPLCLKTILSLGFAHYRLQ